MKRIVRIAFFLLPFAAAANADTQAVLEQLRRSTGTPGISAAVARHGRIVFSGGSGYADLDNLVPATGATVYNVGSISKVITATAVMQLVEQGKVSLDDPIQKYVPSFPDKGQVITVRHLMTQTSGIRHYRRTDFPESSVNENMKPMSFEEGLRIFKDDPLLFKPGTAYSYSSYAVNLLQGVVEAASGMKFEDYLRQHVWTPAAMLSTSFDVPDRIVPGRAKGYEVEKGQTTNFPYGDVSYKFASGGMLSSAEDLVRFGSALSRLLKPETLAAMSTPVVIPTNAPKDFSQGLMWRIFTDEAGRRFLNHCGTVKGFNACLVIYPEEEVVAALLGNGDPVTPARKPTVTLAQSFLPGAAAEPPSLKQEIEAQDAAMFAAFNTHDLAKTMAFFSNDLEFYHDKNGLQSRASVNDGFAKLFAQNNGLHRELVPGTLEVYPLDGDGAIQLGAHKFCHVENGRDDCGTFRFTHVWRKKDGRWRVTRALSYGH